MNIHILNSYIKEVPAQFEGYFDIQPLKEYLEEEIKEYSDNYEIDDDILYNEIYDFLKQEDCEIDPFNMDDDVALHSFEQRDGLEVLNIEELVQYFSYLKRLPIKNNCCDDQTGNYCSHCGTKLK
jgi:hypothetical protein